MKPHPPKPEVVQYLDWIKRRAPHDESTDWGLALSGMPDPDPAILSPLSENLVLFGNNHNGWQPWKEALADLYGVKPENVCTSFGTAQSCFLAIGAFSGPDEKILLEFPSYDPLYAVPHTLGCNITLLNRHRSLDWKFDPVELREHVRNGIKLLIMTNPHNPTGVFYTEEEISEIAAILGEHGGYLFVDEVYRDAVPDRYQTTTVKLADNILTAASWTKVYGLSAIRSGWVFGSPEVIHACEQVNDRLCARAPLLAEEMCARIARRPDLLKQCGPDRLGRLAINRATLRKTIEQTGWDAVVPESAMTVAIKHPKLDGNEAHVKALEAGILVTPGRFFGLEDRFRISFTTDTANFETLLSRLVKALG